MKTTTRTIIYETLKDSGREVEVRVDNECPDKCPYGIDVGCIDEWLTDKDFDTLLTVLTKAKSLRVLPKKTRTKRK